MFHVWEFWPFFTAGKRRFDYRLEADDAIQFSSVFSFDPATASMLYRDFDGAGKWLDTWFYQQRPGFGVAEWRDDYPGKCKVFREPIGWGDVVDVGTVYQNEPCVDVFRTWPPTWPLKGWQMVAYEARLESLTLRTGATFEDVLQFVYFQRWGSLGGARYWMARGVGPIAVQWIAPTNMSTSGRYDAAVSEG